MGAKKRGRKIRMQNKRMKNYRKKIAKLASAAMQAAVLSAQAMAQRSISARMFGVGCLPDPGNPDSGRVLEVNYAVVPDSKRTVKLKVNVEEL